MISDNGHSDTLEEVRELYEPGDAFVLIVRDPARDVIGAVEVTMTANGTAVECATRGGAPIHLGETPAATSCGWQLCNVIDRITQTGD